MKSKILKTKVSSTKSRKKPSARVITKKTSAKKPVAKKLKSKLKALKAKKEPVRLAPAEHLWNTTPVDTGKTNRKPSRSSPQSSAGTSSDNSSGTYWTYSAVGAVIFGLGVMFWAYRDIPLQPTLTSLSATDIKPESEIHLSLKNLKDLKDLKDEFKQAQRLDFGKSLEFWSSYLEKNQKDNSKIIALSKGQEVNDSAPLVPTEYNCTTFVETVAALARSQNSDSFIKNLIQIRYKDGKPSFENRNHFPELDWIPNNQRAEILKDVTPSLADQTGVSLHLEKKEIDRGKWLAAQTRGGKISRSLASALSKEWLTPAGSEVPYIAIEDMNQILDHIPNGTVLNLVHKSDELHPVLITHQGFVIRSGERVLFRHATLGGKIRTNDLRAYLQSAAQQQKVNTAWPLIGINLNQMNDSTSSSNFFNESM